MSITRLLPALLCVACLAALPAQAQRDFSGVEVKATPLRGSTHLLTGAGGNIVASVGADGTFLVDDQFAPLTDRIQAALRGIDPQAAKRVRFVLNTHWHGDHTGGNGNLAGAGATVVAHDNVRTRLASRQVHGLSGEAIGPSPAAALPVVTFEDGLTLHLNGDTVHVRHVSAAHTDGDALVKFEAANVLHMGDTWFNGLYPYIDVGSGGSIGGVLAAISRGLALSDGDTIVVPGHGPVGRRADLVAYGAMLQRHRDAIAAMKAKGRTLDEVIAARPTRDTDQALGGGFIKPAQLVTFIYETLE